MDGRLSKNDFRVLGAILSFRNKNTNLCWPKRGQISERCGLPVTRISTVTSRLVELGWLEKIGNGGCSRSTKYALTVPEIEPKTVTETVTKTVTKPVTVTEAVTVTEPVIETVTEPVTKTVTETVTRIKQTNEQTNEQTKRGGLSAEKFFVPAEINLDAWTEFEQHRKEIRKPLSNLARKKAVNQIKNLTHAQQQFVIDYSIAGRYTGLFPERIKTNQNGRSHEASKRVPNQAEQFLENLRAYDERHVDSEVVCGVAGAVRA